MKLVLLTDQKFGYDLKMIGFPIDQDQVQLIEQLIPENAYVYADRKMLAKLQPKLAKYHYLVEPTNAEYVITDADFSSFINKLDEIVVIRKYRTYPHMKIFSIAQLSQFEQKPSYKQSHTFANGKRIDVLKYKLKPITPTYAKVSKDVVASMPSYMYREKPINRTDTGWRFFSKRESKAYEQDLTNFEYMPINELYGYNDLLKTWISQVPEGYEIDLTSFHNESSCLIYGGEFVVYEEYVVDGKLKPVFGLVHGAQFNLPHSKQIDPHKNEYVIELQEMTLQEKLQITDTHKNPIIKERSNHEA